jgi:hypothetical protein
VPEFEIQLRNWFGRYPVEMLECEGNEKLRNVAKGQPKKPVLLFFPFCSSDLTTFVRLYLKETGVWSSLLMC